MEVGIALLLLPLLLPAVPFSLPTLASQNFGDPVLGTGTTTAPSLLPPASEFVVQLDLAPSARPLSLVAIRPEQLVPRLEAICRLALRRAMDRHLFGGAGGGERSKEGEIVPRMGPGGGGGLAEVPEQQQPFRVRVLGMDPSSPSRPFLRLQFVASFQGRPIPAQALLRDLSLLSIAELSASLQLPVLRLVGFAQAQTEEQKQWWLVALIASGGLLVIGCGWALLFCWLNICVRREEVHSQGQGLGHGQGQNEEERKEEKQKERGGEAGGKAGGGRLRSNPKEALDETIGRGRKKSWRRRMGFRKRSRSWGRNGTGRRSAGKEEAVAASRNDPKEEEAKDGWKAANGDGKIANGTEQKAQLPLEDRQTEEILVVADGQQQQQPQPLAPLPSPTLPPAPHPPNRRFNPYWTADQLERIFHFSTSPSTGGHPRPAAPTEDGEMRIGGQTGEGGGD